MPTEFITSKHLGKGDPQPPKLDGKLRLYSMQFCPFAERTRLVLLTKAVAYDVVNINLKNKPDWLYNLSPKGMVPILDTGTEIVTESLIISDYLDEKYPEPALYPSDPQKKMEDKILLKNMEELINLYYVAKYNRGNELLSVHLSRLNPYVQKLEEELGKRGRYFGGEKPNMVDYMLWPFAERAKVLEKIYEATIPGSNKFPRLYAWCTQMRTLEVIQLTETTVERQYKLHLQYQDPNSVDYDSI